MMYTALHAEYRFTQSDGSPFSEERMQDLDEKLFDLIGEFAADNNLDVAGGSAWECEEAQQ